MDPSITKNLIHLTEVLGKGLGKIARELELQSHLTLYRDLRAANVISGAKYCEVLKESAKNYGIMKEEEEGGEQ